MIKLKKVIARNFFHTGNAPLEIVFDQHKTTLCYGKNGSGKSSNVIDTVVYALFGKPYRKANIPTIINRINKSGLLVELYFESYGNEYYIKRGQKPDIFEIYCNGELINQTAKKTDYQEYLEKSILKLTYKTFTNCVVLGSARYKPFMQMTSADRREIIEDLLDIQVFSSMNVISKKHVSSLKDEIGKVEYDLSLVEEKIELQENYLKQLEENSDIQRKTIENEIQSQNESIVRYEQDLNNIQVKIKEKQEELSSQDNRDKLNKLIQLEAKLEDKIKKLKKDWEFFTTNDVCPTCKQTIDQTFKEHKCNEIDETKSKSTNALTEIEIKIHELSRHLQEQNEIYEQISDLKIESNRINGLLTGVKNHVNMLLNSLENVAHETQSDNLDSLKEEKTSLNKELKKLNEDKLYYDYILTLLKDKGIKAQIIKKYVPMFNSYVNFYLEKLGLYASFSIDENFNETLKSGNKQTFTYENMSEGERLRLDLAILFSFRDLSKVKNKVNVNLLIMDEIFDSSLDVDGTDNLLELFYSDSFLDKQNIVVISHKTEINSEKFDRIIRFYKKGNFSKMEEEVKCF